MVAGEETVERGLRVPLELQQFPRASSCRASRRRSWTSACAARPATLSRLSAGDVVAVLDLRTRASGPAAVSS